MARPDNRPPAWTLVVLPGAAALLVIGFVIAEGRVHANDPASDQTIAAPQVDEPGGTSTAAIPLPRPADRPLRVLFVGDSITRGAYASVEAATFPALIVSALESEGPVDDVIPHSAAQTTTQALDEGVGRSGPADLIFVNYGSADVDKSNLFQFAQDYQTLLGQLRQASPAAEMVCAGPWGRSDKTRPFDDRAQAACEAEGGEFVPLSGLYPSELLHAQVGELSFRGTVNDDFHPNDRGHSRIAEALLTPLGLAVDASGE